MASEHKMKQAAPVLGLTELRTMQGRIDGTTIYRDTRTTEIQITVIIPVFIFALLFLKNLVHWQYVSKLRQR
jgi:hypothetical protein